VSGAGTGRTVLASDRMPGSLDREWSGAPTRSSPGTVATSWPRSRSSWMTRVGMFSSALSLTDVAGEARLRSLERRRRPQPP
jgi:hypothetical protein